MLDFPTSLQNQFSQLLAMAGARNRPEGHCLACPKLWVVGHCPCKGGTSWRTPCKHRGVAEGSAAEGSSRGSRADFAVPVVF